MCMPTYVACVHASTLLVTGAHTSSMLQRLTLTLTLTLALALALALTLTLTPTLA